MLRVSLLIILFLLTIGPVRTLGVPLTNDAPLEDYAQYTDPDQPPDLTDRPLSRGIVKIRNSYIAFLGLLNEPVTETQTPFPEGQGLIVNLDNQELYKFEDGWIRDVVPVSTGVSGHRTPTGEYAVYGKDRRAWSNKYECAMLNWLAITKTGAYGIHALEGTSYLRKLGRTASHGCVRVSHDDAKELYGWAEIGTPVKIVRSFDPFPFLAAPVDIPKLPVEITSEPPVF